MAAIGLTRSANEFFRQNIQEFFDLQRDGRSFVNVVVVGETGAGKSSTIAEITGKRTSVSHSLKPEHGTQRIEEHTFTNNGITINLLDIPGFDGNVATETTLQALRTNFSRQTDLVVYCISMEAKRWPTQSDETSIRRMIDILGPTTFLGNRCVFALTFADKIIQSCPAGQNVDEVLRHKQNEFEEQILETLKKYLPGEHLPRNLHIAPIFNQPKARYERVSRILKIRFLDLVYDVLHTHLSAFSCFFHYFRPSSIQQDDNSSSNEQVTDSNPHVFREPDTSPSDNPEEIHNGAAYRILDNDLDDEQSAFMRFINETWENSQAKVIWTDIKEFFIALREYFKEAWKKITED